MKPGCFIKVVVTITIVTAVILWMVQNKHYEFILNPGKKALAELMIGDIDKRIAILKENSEKDSLKFMLKDFMEHEVISFKKFNTEMFDPFEDSLNQFTSDSIINKTELHTLSLLIEKLKVEGSTKD